MIRDNSIFKQRRRNKLHSFPNVACIFSVIFCVFLFVDKNLNITT